MPPLFMATNSVSGQQVQWEVVDGLQRLLTLVNFAGSQNARAAARSSKGPLKLEGLEKLTNFNDHKCSELPEDVSSALEDRPIKVVVLNDKSDLQVRFDLFERLNTGGVALTAHEVRECVYRGPFMDFVGACAKSPSFRQILHLPEARWKDGTPEDFALRFFAFTEEYGSFDHSVKDFLNSFAKEALCHPKLERRNRVFVDTFQYLHGVFPNGLKTRKGQTPVNLFEAVAAGAALALHLRPDLPVVSMTDWIGSDRLRSLTTGATNSNPRVRGRIEFCRDRFLGLPINV